jgi:hypothetical protein
MDSRLQGIAGINDFGQAIMNANRPLLFTPRATWPGLRRARE